MKNIRLRLHKDCLLNPNILKIMAVVKEITPLCGNDRGLIQPIKRRESSYGLCYERVCVRDKGLAVFSSVSRIKEKTNTVLRPLNR